MRSEVVLLAFDLCIDTPSNWTTARPRSLHMSNGVLVCLSLPTSIKSMLAAFFQFFNYERKKESPVHIHTSHIFMLWKYSSSLIFTHTSQSTHCTVSRQQAESRIQDSDKFLCHYRERLRTQSMSNKKLLISVFRLFVIITACSTVQKF